MRLVAHLLSGLAAAFWLLLLLTGALGSGEGRFLVPWILLLASFTLLAWRRPRLGGWFLLAGGMAFGLVAAALAGRAPGVAFFLTGLPFILSGLLFVCSFPRPRGGLG